MTGRAWRRACDLARVPRDWIAYWLVMLLPLPSHAWIERLGFALLPYAGSWAYRYDPWVVLCRRYWIATGMQLPAPEEADAADALAEVLARR